MKFLCPSLPEKGGQVPSVSACISQCLPLSTSYITWIQHLPLLCLRKGTLILPTCKCPVLLPYSSSFLPLHPSSQLASCLTGCREMTVRSITGLEAKRGNPLGWGWPSAQFTDKDRLGTSLQRRLPVPPPRVLSPVMDQPAMTLQRP